MSHELGKHLHELVGWCGPLTHRQYLAWTRWLQEEWNQPSRTDHYLMQVAAEVCRSRVKEPKEVALKDFKVTWSFEPVQPEKTPEQRKMESQATTARWLGAFGGNFRIRQPDGSLAHVKDIKNG